MSHPVYFCFHQQRDEDRARVVSALTGTVDKNRLSDWHDESWEAAVEAGPESVAHEIDKRLAGTEVTCLLIGEKTWEKGWIPLMLKRSHELGRGILAIHVHGIPDRSGYTVKKGSNPMGRLHYLGRDRQEYPFASAYSTYDWEHAEGAENLPDWIAEAARQAGIGEEI